MFVLLNHTIRSEKRLMGLKHFHRVLDDPNAVPTEYAVQLPPEYSPLRSYPAVVALHNGRGETPLERMQSAIDWWGPEAARRGYIVIAPDYISPGQAGGGQDHYRYSPTEHAAASANADLRKESPPSAAFSARARAGRRVPVSGDHVEIALGGGGRSMAASTPSLRARC